MTNVNDPLRKCDGRYIALVGRLLPHEAELCAPDPDEVPAGPPSP